VTPLAVEDRRDLMRWLACGVTVLFVHAGIAFGLVEWREPFEDGNSGTDAITLELEPMQVPPEVRTDLPAGPEQAQAEPTPDKPAEKTEEKPEPLPKQDSETMVAPTLPDPQPQPVPYEDNPPAPTTSAPQPARARVSVPTWKSQIAAILERNKQYPPGARARREQGVVQLAFSIDRQGHVVSSRIVASSGSAALDEETLALVQRSQPFPTPPAELPGAEVSFTVPVRYNFR
jgi:protein TonB